eukprot:3114419-Lingulodinium_polyedra.AAC.1
MRLEHLKAGRPEARLPVPPGWPPPGRPTEARPAGAAGPCGSAPSGAAAAPGARGGPIAPWPGAGPRTTVGEWPEG